MRTLLVGAAFILLSYGPARAQDRTIPPLQRIVDWHVELTLPVDECSVPIAVRTLTQRLHFLAGIEFLPGGCRASQAPKPTSTITLHGLSLSDALDKLVAIDSRYRWVDSDGVIVVRPLAAWADPKNVLNFESASFTLEDANLYVALSAVVSALQDKPRESLGEGIPTSQGSRLFSVTTGPTSVGGALDAIVRAHGDGWWELQDFTAGPGMRLLYLQTFDGSFLRSLIRSVPRLLRIDPIQHSRIRNRLPDVLEAANPAHAAFDTHTEPSVRH
jgi:hypothetical protein